MLKNNKKKFPNERTQILNNHMPYLNPSGLWMFGFSGSIPKCCKSLPVSGMKMIRERKPKQFRLPATDEPADGWKSSRIIGERTAAKPFVVRENTKNSVITSVKLNFSVKKPSGIQHIVAITVALIKTHFLGNRKVSVK